MKINQIHLRSKSSTFPEKAKILVFNNFKIGNEQWNGKSTDYTYSKPVVTSIQGLQIDQSTLYIA